MHAEAAYSVDAHSVGGWSQEGLGVQREVLVERAVHWNEQRQRRLPCPPRAPRLLQVARRAPGVAEVDRKVERADVNPWQ